MSRKPEVLHEQRTIEYSPERWSILSNLRKQAGTLLTDLTHVGLRGFVYGSVARGDVNKDSDIDIILLDTVPSYKVELSIGKGIKRELVQATPSSVLKAHLYVDHGIVVSFPLFKMMSREREFYKWGGMIGLQELESDVRVPGVDKRLILIEPNEKGHSERGVIDYEWYAAKILDVSPAIAQERVRVLTRRDSVGRTGVYRTHVLQSDEAFEEVAKQLVDSDPALRRTIKRRE